MYSVKFRDGSEKPLSEVIKESNTPKTDMKVDHKIEELDQCFNIQFFKEGEDPTKTGTFIVPIRVEKVDMLGSEIGVWVTRMKPYAQTALENAG